jgi:tetratricopeptide (TPR) repeat protein
LPPADRRNTRRGSETSRFEEVRDEASSAAVTTNPERRRRRLLAIAGMWLLLAGLLTALSLVLVVLAVSTLMLLAGLSVIVGRHLRRVDVRPALRTSARSTKTAARTTTAALGAASTHVPRPRVREHARAVGSTTRRAVAGAPGLTARATRGSIDGMYRLGVLRVHSVDPGRRALELNELGTQLRREGEPEAAAEQHRAALALVRDIGDQQAEAMTLNNLGLALAHSGAEEAAVEHLEQAVDVLRELGDEEHEARVIANLGVVHRRQGHHDEAVSLLSEALEKLPPESPFYRQVEKELVRAS